MHQQFLNFGSRQEPQTLVPLFGTNKSFGGTEKKLSQKTEVEK